MAETSEPVEVSAWDDEWQYVVIWGTHDAESAGDAYRSYLAGCGFKPGDDEYSPDADRPEFYQGMVRLWTDAKDGEDYLDRFTEPGDGRVPYMFGSLT